MERKKSKFLIASYVLFGAAAWDVIFNTLVAIFTNGGQPTIQKSVLIGPIVVNTITIPAVLGIASACLAIGLLARAKQKKGQ